MSNHDLYQVEPLAGDKQPISSHTACPSGLREGRGVRERALVHQKVPAMTARIDIRIGS